MKPLELFKSMNKVNEPLTYANTAVIKLMKMANM